MKHVNVTELRGNLNEYITEVQMTGQPLAITSRGKVIVRMLPPEDEKDAAKARLLAMRSSAIIGDITSPIGDPWDAQA
jgi:prevent-host-death family protein